MQENEEMNLNSGLIDSIIAQRGDPQVQKQIGKILSEEQIEAIREKYTARYPSLKEPSNVAAFKEVPVVVQYDDPYLQLEADRINYSLYDPEAFFKEQMNSNASDIRKSTMRIEGLRESVHQKNKQLKAQLKQS